jgi:hypothetical protein
MIAIYEAQFFQNFLSMQSPQVSYIVAEELKELMKAGNSYLKNFGVFGIFNC